MKIALAIIVAALAILLGPVVWQFTHYQPQDVPSSGLPWQIETLPGGEAQVFGLTLGVRAKAWSADLSIDNLLDRAGTASAGRNTAGPIEYFGVAPRTLRLALERRF